MIRGEYEIAFSHSERLADVWELRRNGQHITDVLCHKGNTDTPAAILDSLFAANKNRKPAGAA